MKTVLITLIKSLLIGIAVALLGFYLLSRIWDGSNDMTVILGWGIYLCLVIVVCTGLILSKIKK